MTQRAADVRAAAGHSAHAALPAVVGLVGLGAAVGSLMMVLKYRRRARERSFRGRMSKLSEALQHPAPALDAISHSAQEKLRAELGAFTAKPQRPALGSRLLEVAVKAAVSTATGVVLKAAVNQLLHTAGGPSGTGRGGS